MGEVRKPSGSWIGGVPVADIINTGGEAGLGLAEPKMTLT